MRLLSTLFFCLVATSAHAELIKYDFTGTVTVAVGEFDGLVGERVRGSLFYSLDPAVVEPVGVNVVGQVPRSVSYFWDRSITEFGMILDFAGQVHDSRNEALAARRIQLRRDVPEFEFFHSCGTGVCPDFSELPQFLFELQGGNGVLPTDLSLPGANFLTLDGWDTAGGRYVTRTGDLTFEIDALLAVTAPSTIGLWVAFMLLVQHGRWQVRFSPAS